MVKPFCFFKIHFGVFVNSLRASLLLICVGGLSLAAEHNWSVGKVLDSNAKRDLVQTGETFHASTYGTATATTDGTVYNSGNTSTVNATTEASGQSTTNGTMQVQHTVFQDNQIFIQGGNYIYTVNDLTQKAIGFPAQGALARAIANRKHGCRTVIGDPIQYEQVKDKLFVRDPDGKVCKMDIVRQERIPNTQSASASR